MRATDHTHQHRSRAIRLREHARRKTQRKRLREQRARKRAATKKQRPDAVLPRITIG